MKTPAGIQLIKDTRAYYGLSNSRFALAVGVTTFSVWSWQRADYRNTPNSTNQRKIFAMAFEAGLLDPTKFTLAQQAQYFS
jgi:hypothetical protein